MISFRATLVRMTSRTLRRDTARSSRPLDRLSRRDLPPGWVEQCGALAALGEHIQPAGEHDHPTHLRHPRDTHLDRACDDEPGQIDLDMPWLCEHGEYPQPVPAHLHDVDAAVASDLLRLLPRAIREDDLIHRGPPIGKVLEAITRHPELRGHGRVRMPGQFMEGIAIELLTIADPDLCEEEPDAVAGPLPSWTDGLDADDHATYLRSRQTCLDCSFDRRARFLTTQRYGLDVPSRRVVVDPFPVGTRDGVAIAWH